MFSFFTHLHHLPSFKLTKDCTHQSHPYGDTNSRKHIWTKTKRLLILRRRFKWQRWWFWLLMKLDFIASSFFLFCNECRTNYLLLPRISNYSPPFAGECCNWWWSKHSVVTERSCSKLVCCDAELRELKYICYILVVGGQKQKLETKCSFYKVLLWWPDSPASSDNRIRAMGQLANQSQTSTVNESEWTLLTQHTS